MSVSMHKSLVWIYFVNLIYVYIQGMKQMILSMKHHIYADSIVQTASQTSLQRKNTTMSIHVYNNANSQIFACEIYYRALQRGWMENTFKRLVVWKSFVFFFLLFTTENINGM